MVIWCHVTCVKYLMHSTVTHGTMYPVCSTLCTGYHASCVQYLMHSTVTHGTMYPVYSTLCTGYHASCVQYLMHSTVTHGTTYPVYSTLCRGYHVSCVQYLIHRPVTYGIIYDRPSRNKFTRSIMSLRCVILIGFVMQPLVVSSLQHFALHVWWRLPVTHGDSTESVVHAQNTGSSSISESKECVWIRKSSAGQSQQKRCDVSAEHSKMVCSLHSWTNQYRRQWNKWQ